MVTSLNLFLFLTGGKRAMHTHTNLQYVQHEGKRGYISNKSILLLYCFLCTKQLLFPKSWLFWRQFFHRMTYRTI